MTKEEIKSYNEKLNELRTDDLEHFLGFNESVENCFTLINQLSEDHGGTTISIGTPGHFQADEFYYVYFLENTKYESYGKGVTLSEALFNMLCFYVDNKEEVNKKKIDPKSYLAVFIGDLDNLTSTYNEKEGYSLKGLDYRNWNVVMECYNKISNLSEQGSLFIKDSERSAYKELKTNIEEVNLVMAYECILKLTKYFVEEYGYRPNK